jgi:hypothetical protein
MHGAREHHACSLNEPISLILVDVHIISWQVQYERERANTAHGASASEAVQIVESGDDESCLLL